MHERTKRLTVFALTALLSSGIAASEPDGRPEKPNVLLLLADDLGWQDLKCYDVDAPSPMETPHIDAFAKKGVLFWQGYSPAPTCAPSRCAILSGNHPARAQKTHVVGGAPPRPHRRGSRMMDPWYSGRMPADEMTLARALRKNGYTTGHSGKWHIAISHKAFPQPEDLGFDYTRSSRGSRSSMDNRLAGFATSRKDDPYRLDQNGYPYHQTNEDALNFLKQNKDKPFFLYYATWLVHAPIHTRSEAHLQKYVDRLGTDPANLPNKDAPGQRNPFYCAMVQELDYYVGAIFEYLEEADDPRWPGHKLSENTYVIFTSDNGGMEGSAKERYTDNEPLARGKISAMEGGTRVPLLVAGPGITAGIETNVMANGLDFYPTILAMTKTPKPGDKNLDGCDLLPLLHNDPQDAELVKHADGTTRDTMVWHFPHGSAMESTIRVGDFKLVRNYDHVNNPQTDSLQLFRLYDSSAGESQREDIEESKNLALTNPELAETMNRQLTEALTEMKASLPHYNPTCVVPLPHQNEVCTVKSHQRQGQRITVTYQENGSQVVRANLIYTLNGGEQFEEWFRKPATLAGAHTMTVELPEGTTHYYVNLIDEHHFLRSYPEAIGQRKSYTGNALSTDSGSVSVSQARTKSKSTTDHVEADKRRNNRGIAFDRWDTDQDGTLSREEYQTGLAGKPGLEERFQRFDRSGDGKVSREEFLMRK